MQREYAVGMCCASMLWGHARKLLTAYFLLLTAFGIWLRFRTRLTTYYLIHTDYYWLLTTERLRSEFQVSLFTSPLTTYYLLYLLLTTYYFRKSRFRYLLLTAYYLGDSVVGIFSWSMQRGYAVRVCCGDVACSRTTYCLLLTTYYFWYFRIRILLTAYRILLTAYYFRKSSFR